MIKHNNTTKGDEEPTILTIEVLKVPGESSWCIFCGSQSRNKHKRDTCDTYEAVNKMKVPRGLKKWQKRLAMKGNNKPDLNHIKCSMCNSSTCIACITSI